MIKRPTVFVLGAGASQPYGFPLGSTLSEQVQRAILDERSMFAQDLCSAGTPPDFIKLADVRRFAAELQASGRYSIDEFLPHQPGYRQIAKSAIAQTLIPHETDARLDYKTKHRNWSQEERDGRWYRYFFNQLLISAGRGPRAFITNRVTFVTFNFDRSFERALFLFLRANSTSLSDADAIEQMRQIPIFHLHGQLGYPTWLGSAAAPDTGTRPYDAAFSSAAWVRACAQQIRIVDEEVTDNPQLPCALTALEEAERVVFLGFSYHPLNLSKLRIEQLKGKRVLGTAYGIPSGRQSAIIRTFTETGIDLHLLDHDVLTFLENTDLIYD